MGTVSRVGAFTNGTVNDGTEVDAEFDNIIATINGDISDVNISGSANIAYTKLGEIDTSKVADFAADAGEYATTATAGDSGAPVLPTSLTTELTKLRGRIGRNKGYSSTSQTPQTFYMNGGAQAAHWFEPPIVGHNLLPNSGFEAPLVSSIPPGWAVVGAAPTSVSVDAAAHPDTGRFKRALNVTTGGAGRGFSATVTGLKASAKYLVGMNYSLSAGTITLATTGGLAAGAYSNLSLSDGSAAASTVETLQGIVKATTAPASAIVVQFTGDATAVFKIHKMWMYEVNEGYPIDLPWIPTQTADHNTTETITNAGEGAWENISELSLSAYVPFQGYRLIYEVALSWTSPTNTNEMNEYAFRIQRNIDGAGATAVEGPYTQKCGGLGTSDEVKFGGTLFMRYVLDNPTAGSTYAMTFDVHTEGTDGADNRSNTIELNPTVNTNGGTLQTVSRARLLMERL